MKPLQSILLNFIRRIITLVLAILSLYLVMAFLGAIIPANMNWKPATSDEAVDIFVETNGVHVSIILPIANDQGILSDKLRASHLALPQYHTQFAMIGWGHKGVYQNAENWNDLTLSDAASAVLGTGDSLLHIYYRNDPKPNSYRKKIPISHAQYMELMKNISSYFKYDEHGNLTIFPGYGPDNIFYEAKGKYSAINTCNVWAGAMLREAGIKIGYWTPFSQSIIYRDWQK